MQATESQNYSLVDGLNRLKSQFLPATDKTQHERNDSEQTMGAPRSSLAPPFIGEKSLGAVLKTNKSWAEAKTAEDPEFFARQALGQSPKILWIGCSDSRVPPTDITCLGAGDIFVHRNIGNGYYADDSNVNSVIEYAVKQLGVWHVVVCGHYRCGAVAASLGDKTGLPHVDTWIAQIKDTVSQFKAQLDQLAEAKQQDLVSQLNAISNAKKIALSPPVQDAWQRGTELTVHAWCYRLSRGHIEHLGLELNMGDDVEAKTKAAIDATLSAALSK
ncbi:hypothetical protein HDU91_000813 [Kappamyces sp. JEL0680]|nr:hypothetical protein HDU91_000813 [Kappamyces sp. JEL0680]